MRLRSRSPSLSLSDHLRPTAVLTCVPAHLRWKRNGCGVEQAGMPR